MSPPSGLIPASAIRFSASSCFRLGSPAPLLGGSTRLRANAVLRRPRDGKREPRGAGRPRGGRGVSPPPPTRTLLGDRGEEPERRRDNGHPSPKGQPSAPWLRGQCRSAWRSPYACG